MVFQAPLNEHGNQTHDLLPQTYRESEISITADSDTPVQSLDDQVQEKFEGEDFKEESETAGFRVNNEGEKKDTKPFDPAVLDSSDSEDILEDKKPKGCCWCYDWIKHKQALFKLMKTAIPVLAGMNFKGPWKRFFAQNITKRNEDKPDASKYAFVKFKPVMFMIMVITIPLIIQSYLSILS